jgi:hypothetical protein
MVRNEGIRSGEWGKTGERVGAGAGP